MGSVWVLNKKNRLNIGYYWSFKYFGRLFTNRLNESELWISLKR